MHPSSSAHRPPKPPGSHQTPPSASICSSRPASFLSANTPGPACRHSLDLKVNWPPQWPEMTRSLAARFLKTLIPRAHTKKQTNKTGSSKSPNYNFLSFEKSLPKPVHGVYATLIWGSLKKHWERGNQEVVIYSSKSLYSSQTHSNTRSFNPPASLRVCLHQVLTP